MERLFVGIQDLVPNPVWNVNDVSSFHLVRLAGDNLSREGIRDAFYKVKNFPTILGPVTVQPDGETMSIVNILKMEGGKQVIVKENY